MFYGNFKIGQEKLSSFIGYKKHDSVANNIPTLKSIRSKVYCDCTIIKLFLKYIHLILLTCINCNCNVLYYMLYITLHEEGQIYLRTYKFIYVFYFKSGDNV